MECQLLVKIGRDLVSVHMGWKGVAEVGGGVLSRGYSFLNFLLKFQTQNRVKQTCVPLPPDSVMNILPYWVVFV